MMSLIGAVVLSVMNGYSMRYARLTLKETFIRGLIIGCILVLLGIGTGPVGKYSSGPRGEIDSWGELQKDREDMGINPPLSALVIVLCSVGTVVFSRIFRRTKYVTFDQLGIRWDIIPHLHKHPGRPMKRGMPLTFRDIGKSTNIINGYLPKTINKVSKITEEEVLQWRQTIKKEVPAVILKQDLDISIRYTAKPVTFSQIGIRKELIRPIQRWFGVTWIGKFSVGYFFGYPSEDVIKWINNARKHYQGAKRMKKVTEEEWMGWKNKLLKMFPELHDGMESPYWHVPIITAEDLSKLDKDFYMS